jgi:hypothetical protein
MVALGTAMLREKCTTTNTQAMHKFVAPVPETGGSIAETPINLVICWEQCFRRATVLEVLGSIHGSVHVDVDELSKILDKSPYPILTTPVPSDDDVL